MTALKLRCYCSEHLLADRRKRTALATETKGWPAEHMAALQSRRWLSMATVPLAGGWRGKLLVPEC